MGFGSQRSQHFQKGEEDILPLIYLQHLRLPQHLTNFSFWELKEVVKLASVSDVPELCTQYDLDHKKARFFKKLMKISYSCHSCHILASTTPCQGEILQQAQWMHCQPNVIFS